MLLPEAAGPMGLFITEVKLLSLNRCILVKLGYWVLWNDLCRLEAEPPVISLGTGLIISRFTCQFVKF